MDNQHRKISGYRELNKTEIDLMNEIKALGPQIESVILKVQEHVNAQRNACYAQPTPMGERRIVAPYDLARLDNATPERFVALAKTDFQTALMYLVRSVAQPETF